MKIFAHLKIDPYNKDKDANRHDFCLISDLSINQKHNSLKTTAFNENQNLLKSDWLDH